MLKSSLWFQKHATLYISLPTYPFTLNTLFQRIIKLINCFKNLSIKYSFFFFFHNIIKHYLQDVKLKVQLTTSQKEMTTVMLF